MTVEGPHVAVHRESPLVFAWLLVSNQVGLEGAGFISVAGEDGQYTV